MYRTNKYTTNDAKKKITDQQNGIMFVWHSLQWILLQTNLHIQV